LQRNAYAPDYGNCSLSAEQLKGDMPGCQHFTETLSKYNFYYYSIPEQLIFNWADNKSLFPTTACTNSTTWS
jgi:hypothetical protein